MAILWRGWPFATPVSDQTPMIDPLGFVCPMRFFQRVRLLELVGAAQPEGAGEEREAGAGWMVTGEVDTLAGRRLFTEPETC